ncbi:MAG: FtsX-like permease family protein [bacterium]|nr:FtsX-like permease family protein [bacterium]
MNKMKTEKTRPLKIAVFLLETLLLGSSDFGAMGDYEEQYNRIAERKNVFRANAWYWLQIAIALPVFFYKSVYGSLLMLKSYIKVAFRNLKKQKVYSFVNVIGMAIGMAGFAVFALSAGTKLNADEFHINSDRMYGVIQVIENENKEEEHTFFTPASLLPALETEFPEIEDAVRVMYENGIQVKNSKNAFIEKGILFADPNFFDFFTFELIAGNVNSALTDPFSVLLTEDMALKYFGEEDPVGKTLTVGNEMNLIVTGVCRNPKRTSSITFNLIINMEALNTFSEIHNDWKNNSYSSFVMLRDNADEKRITERLSSFIDMHYADTQDSPNRLYLFPFLDFRLNSPHITNFMRHQFKEAVYVLLFIGILFLFIVCINFISMTTARNMYRTKEIGLRKVVGARRFQIARQFIGESLILSLFAFPLSIVFYELFNPVYSSFLLRSIGSGIGSVMNTSSNSISNYPFLLKYLFSAALLTGIFSGLYPALYLSKLNPIKVMNETVDSGVKNAGSRKLMLFMQFSMSILFIVVATLLKEQSNHFIDADLGYNKERIATIQVEEIDKMKLELLKDEYSKFTSIEYITASSNLPLTWENMQQTRLPGKDDKTSINAHVYGIGYDFLEALEMKIIEGNSFIKDHGNENGFIISETAAERLKLTNPVGEQIVVGERTGIVLGMVQDFLFADIGFEIPPAVLYLEQENLNYLMLKYSSSAGFPEIKELLKEQWNTILPDNYFDCKTLDEQYNKILGMIIDIADFIRAVGLSAMFLSCIGLTGLASYMIARRTKEIGIRKVFGANVSNLIWRLIKEYVVLVALANVIVLTLVTIGWKQVLQFGILYLTDISAGTYIFTIIISLLATLLSVIYQTVKTTRANPVDTLRYE